VDITAFTKRYSRRGLSKPNAAYYLWRFVGNGTRTLRAKATHPTHPDVPAIAHRLSKDGIAVGPSHQFLSDRGQRALADASAQILDTSRSAETEALITGTGDSDRKKKFLVHLVSYSDGIPADEPLLRVALDPKLLEIVTSYLGMWPSLYSIGAWLNYPTDAPAELSQVWHRDPEDLKLVKAFIYLSDVGESSGPFTYIPKTQPFGARNTKARNLDRKTRRVQDSQMTFPPEAWKVCTGPANTMILADTVGYHRGGKPTIGRRTLVTFTFTSGTPIDDSGLWLRDRPVWATSGMQRAAVRWLLDGQRRSRPGRKRH
jgi:hypothetical protein